jgi:hypothetical protein
MYQIAGFMWYLGQDAKMKSKERKCLNLYEVMEVFNCVTKVDVKEAISKLSISSRKQNYKNSYTIWPKKSWKYQELTNLQIFLFFF